MDAGFPSLNSVMMEYPFSPGQWIWTPNEPRNQYALFVKSVPLNGPAPIHIRVSASFHYELFLNGQFVARGPVHGDPQWCQYDELTWTPTSEERTLHITILAHHEDVYIHSLSPAPSGVIAALDVNGQKFGTDASWKCRQLKMWSQDVAKRGWALGYAEDYDARLEPDGWDTKVFENIDDWEHAVLVADANQIWSNYQKRMTPYLQRRLVEPISFDAFVAPGGGASEMAKVSEYSDDETLLPIARGVPYSFGAVSRQKANAYTFDLGREYIGFYYFDIEAPAGKTVEISGAELLREGRPWIYRKGTTYSARYHTKEGRQQFTSFNWSGFRYLHLVIRDDAGDVIIHNLGCIERKAPLSLKSTPPTGDALLNEISELCRYTLEVGVQEHLIDCPTREQAQYWGDAVFIAQSLWKGADEPRYLQWYLECFLRVPFNKNGQISSVYPGGRHTALLDYSLIPLIGQRFYKQNTGAFHKPQETFEKALRLKGWYDENTNENGLIAFNFEEYLDHQLINFIDHPGLGWHDFPHSGIDRQGISCALNLFYYGFLQILAEIAHDIDASESGEIRQQAKMLAQTLRATFFDGEVFYDAIDDGIRSQSTSWQANALAVYFDVVSQDEATVVMQAMLDRYDSVCRCSPYFHFYFLWALRKAGLEDEAAELIKREWRAMIDGGATTTWEGFFGDEKDSLCHPWSTAPYLFLMEKEV